MSESGCAICGKPLRFDNQSGRCFLCAAARRSTTRRCACGAPLHERAKGSRCRVCFLKALGEAARLLDEENHRTPSARVPRVAGMAHRGSR